MPRQFLFVALTTASIALAISVPSACAVGYWNVPGNVAQWWGYGCGPGHHACLVLGPISPKGAFVHNQTRLPHAPKPPYGCYDGCTYNYDFRHPSQFVPVEYQRTPQPNTPVAYPSAQPMSPELAPDTLPMPAASAPEADYWAPVER